MYSIINRDKRNGYGDDMLIVAEDQSWTSEDCEQLKREENIFYNRGVFAIQKIERIDSNPLLRIAIEDDGHILFNDDHCISFDAGWLGDLLNVLDGVKFVDAVNKLPLIKQEPKAEKVIREEMEKYTKLTGEDATHVPIMKIRAYLDGYEKGTEVLDKIRTEILRISSYEGFELGGVKDGYRIAIVNVLDIIAKLLLSIRQKSEG